MNVFQFVDQFQQEPHNGGTFGLPACMTLFGHAAPKLHPNHADERFSSCGKDLTEAETARERSLVLRRGA